MHRVSAEERSIPCATCGRPIDPKSAVYSTAGALVCAFCNSNQMVAESGAKAGKSAFYSALGALGLGLFSVPCNLFFLLSFAAILGGIVSIKLCMRPEFRATLGTLYPWTLGAAIGAIVFGAVQPTFWAMAIMVAAVR